MTKEELTTLIYNALQDHADEAGTENPADNYICLEDLECNELDEWGRQVTEQIQESDFFNDESNVTYYATAIKILQENDPSFVQSLKKAAEMGFSLENLNSEKLASLLNFDLIQDEFSGIEEEINDLLDGETCEDDDDDDDEEEEKPETEYTPEIGAMNGAEKIELLRQTNIENYLFGNRKYYIELNHEGIKVTDEDNRTATWPRYSSLITWSDITSLMYNLEIYKQSHRYERDGKLVLG